MGDSTRLTTSGRVQASDGIYVERQADLDLLQVCREGRLGVVLHSRQVGKSSLISHVASQLRDEGFVTVSIDFTVFGVHDVKADDWYLAIVDEIVEQLGVEADTDQWWDEQGNRPPVYKLVRILAEVVLAEISERIVVFMDEIDTTLSLPFTDDLFAAIRQCYQRRDEDEAFRRLSFVLVGSSSPTQLMKDEKRTPFNIGTTIDIRDFSRQEVLAFAPAFDLPPEQTRRILGWVHDWTGGHPYLTQVLCAHIVEDEADEWGESDVADLVEAVFLSSEGEQDFNLDNVRDMLTDRWVRQGGDLRALLGLYLKILLGRRVKANSQTDVVQHLLLSGVVVAKKTHLRVRNRIYAEVFCPRWVRYHMPTNWRAIGIGTAVAAGIVVVAAVGLRADEARRDRLKTAYSEAKASRDKDIAELQTRREELNTRLLTLRSATDEAGRVSGRVSSADVDQIYRAAKNAIYELESRQSLHRNAFELQPIRDAFEQAHVRFQAARAAALRQLADAGVEEDLQQYALRHAAAAAATKSEVPEEVYARVMAEYGNVLAVMRGHTSKVHAAAFSPDGTGLVTASEDETIRRWDTETGLPEGPPVSTQSDTNFEPLFIDWQAVAGEPLVLAASQADPFVLIELRPTDEGLRRANTLEMGTYVGAARVSPDGETLLTAGSPTALWTYPDGEQVDTVPRSRKPRLPEHDACFSHDGSLIASPRTDGVVEIFDGTLDRRQRTLATDSSSQVARVQFYEEYGDERWLLTVPFVGTVQIWSVDGGQQLKRIDPPASVTFDGRLCPPPAGSGPGTAATLVVVGREREPTERHVVRRLDVRTSREELAGEASERARITDISPRWTLSTPDRVLAISPSCDVVASVGSDNLVKLRTLLPPEAPTSRNGSVLLERWERLFQRTIEGEKVVDSDSRQNAYSSGARPSPSRRRRAGKMP